MEGHDAGTVGEVLPEPRSRAINGCAGGVSECVQCIIKGLDGPDLHELAKEPWDRDLALNYDFKEEHRRSNLDGVALLIRWVPSFQDHDIHVAAFFDVHLIAKADFDDMIGIDGYAHAMFLTKRPESYWSFIPLRTIADWWS